MNPWIVLLRGINVGGRNILPMADLVDLLGELGCTNIKTYIQSGNVVLCSPEKNAAILKKQIEDGIASRFSFDPLVLVLSSNQLVSAIEANPFPDATEEPATLHFFFLSDISADYDDSVMHSLCAANERFRLVGKVFYLLAPDGIGRSRLAANAEKKLGVASTARNYRTIDKLLQLIAELPKN